jgi:hypothetical protein
MPFQTPGNVPSRGIQNHMGGSYDQSSMQDIVDGDALQGPMTSLVGLADAINPHVAGNYIIDSAAADLTTLGLPTPEVDDNLSIAIFSDTAFAHKITLPSAAFANGLVGLTTVATFGAFRGAGVILRAMDGTWQVLASPGVTFA